MNEDKSRAKANELFTQFLEKNQMRDTRERRAILGKVFDIQGHFTADELYESLMDEGFHVARSTVYTTVGLLVDCGILREHYIRSSAMQYERRIGVGQHFHLICTQCGRVRQLKDQGLSKLLGYGRFPSFVASDVELYIYGKCTKCRRQQRRPSSKNDNKP